MAGMPTEFDSHRSTEGQQNAFDQVDRRAGGVSRHVERVDAQRGSRAQESVRLRPRTRAIAAAWIGSRWWRSRPSPAPGGLANTLFSNYARDKGWGMGARVGAIPSAVGGLPISLSHVGEVFPVDADEPVPLERLDAAHLPRSDLRFGWPPRSSAWRCPACCRCEFIRNATVAGDRVAAMTAEGIAAALSGVRRTVLDPDAVVRLSRAGPGPDQRRRPDRPPLDRHHLDRQQPREADGRTPGANTSTTAS